MESLSDLKYVAERDSQTVVYTHKPMISEYSRKYRPHGLVFSMAWLVANVVDEGGQRYNLIREFQQANSDFCFWIKVIPSLETPDELLYMKPGEITLGFIRNDYDAKKGQVWVRPRFPTPSSFNMVFTEDEIQWTDFGGRLNLSFSLLGPGYEMYVPSKMEGEDIQYRATHYVVHGTLNDTPVKGHGALDWSWCAPGTDYRQSHLYNRLEKYWLAAMNEYPNGDWESLVIVDGIDEHGIGYYIKNGDASAYKRGELSGAYQKNEKGFVTKAELIVGPHKFAVEGYSTGIQAPSAATTGTTEFAEKIIEDPDWGNCAFRNLARNDKPVFTSGWQEFFPNRIISQVL
jgi:hypothetical protein